MRKLIVVTGGTKGIGRAIVVKFAMHGFDVVTSARNKDNLLLLKTEVEKINPDVRVSVFGADMADKHQVKEFIDFINTVGTPVEILVNSVGYFAPGEICTEPEGNLENMMNANLFSAYHLTRGLILGMKERKQGHIFNMCSIASFMAYPNGGSYAISKFALLGFSKCLRQELKETGIRVTSVMPGATFTDSWAGVNLPENRFIPPEDVARVVFSAYSISTRSVVEDIIIRPQLGDI